MINIFDQGYLSDLTEKVLTGNKDFVKLTANQVYQIGTALGAISKVSNLYDTLFAEPDMAVPLLKGDVHTRDLGMFVLMDHTKARGYYMKSPGRTAPTDLFMSPGVPVALEGARRVYGKTYNSWYEDIKDLEDKNEVIKTDMFLPWGLASHVIDPDTGNVENAPYYGIITLRRGGVTFTVDDINEIRNQTPGWLSKHGPKVVPDYELYSKCSPRVRSLIIQGWIWGKQLQLNSDMITDIHDWDATSKPSKIFEGMTPHQVKLPIGYTGLFK
jgi:hypothetical protein